MKRRDHIFVLLLSVIFGVTSAYATTLSIPNTFSPGDTIQSADFNQNFAAISTWANGNITTENLFNGTILAEDISANQITDTQVNPTGLSRIAALAVNTGMLQANAVTGAKMGLGADGAATANIVANAVTTVTQDFDSHSPATTIPEARPTTPTSNTVQITGAVGGENAIVIYTGIFLISSGSRTFSCSVRQDATDDTLVTTFNLKSSDFINGSCTHIWATTLTAGVNNFYGHAWVNDQTQVTVWDERLVVIVLKR